MANTERERREARKAAGRCVNHPGVDAVAGMVICEACRQKPSAHDPVVSKARKDRLSDLGQCRNHAGRVVVPGLLVCTLCVEREKNRKR
jgi:hypothetical protein